MYLLPNTSSHKKIMKDNCKIQTSIQEYTNALELIPGGIKGMHKIFPVDQYPAYFSKGDGCYVFDIDGNKYIDFVMGKGPYILGYGNKEVDQNVIKQISDGNLFPMGNIYQNEVAREILDVVNSAEKVVFYKTGSCATSSAVRLARAYTRKSIVMSSGYHGWHDWCSTGKGILENTQKCFVDFQYNLEIFDKEYKEHKDDIAAVIVTPEEFYLDDGFYQYIQDFCKKNNIVFILDEVKSGFRVDVGGFQKKHQLDPDMTTFSKAISNGYSLAALAGKKQYIDINEEIHTTGTYDTEVISFAAADACIKLIKNLDLPNIIEKRGCAFADRLDGLFQKYHVGLYPVFAGGSFRIWSSDEDLETAFYSTMAKYNVIFYAYDNSYISLAHTEDVLEETLDRVDSALKSMSISDSRKYDTFNRKYLIHDFKNRKGFMSNYIGVSGRKNNE